jgi:D-alanine transaminase
MQSGERVYLNGEIVPYAEAKISVEDRGFNFADGIYEVVRVAGGAPFRAADHLDRFENGARALEIELPFTREQVSDAILETIRANDIDEGTVYVQLTRGAARRAHAFPEGVRPTLVMLARPYSGLAAAVRESGVGVATLPDLRWGYCEVKTIGLLPNVMAYQRSHDEGSYEAIMIRDGVVTEGSHTSAFCVRREKVFTHPIDNILPGITRKHVIASLRAQGIEVEETAVTMEEFRAADEIFITGTTLTVLGVVRIDGEPVGSGKPGKLTQLAMQLYDRDYDAARAEAQKRRQLGQVSD